MEILKAAEMRRVDRRTIEQLGISGDALMEAAGGGVARRVLSEVPDLAARHVLVACGKGNNGGDGLVAARHLRQSGVRAQVVLLARVADLTGDAAVNAARAASAGVAIEECETEAEWSRSARSIDRGTLVIDALLGTGSHGGARGLAAHAIEALNLSGTTIVSIDIPSGVDADSGTLPGITVRAHRTLTLCRPKPCLVLEPAASHAGTWSVLDIGIPDEAVAAESADLSWLDGPVAARLAPPRPQDAHKGTLGHVLVLAGSLGKSGAAILAGRGALRAGAGLVTVACPASVQPVVASGQPELMTEALPESSKGRLSRLSASPALRLLAQRDALAVGPGLSTDAGTRAVVFEILRRRTSPAVLDADGLNAFSTTARERSRLHAGRQSLVLTPHPGEAARLLDTTVGAIQGDRLRSARTLAARTSSIVVLKGRRSVIAQPDGEAAINSTGNAGMATGGTGDVLTGIIGALLARGLAAFDAARLGTYVHGAAGDLAAGRFGPEGMIASDLVDTLPQAWSDLAELRGAMSWTREG